MRSRAAGTKAGQLAWRMDLPRNSLSTVGGLLFAAGTPGFAGLLFVACQKRHRQPTPLLVLRHNRLQYRFVPACRLNSRGVGT
jgi:hypothetical protein